MESIGIWLPILIGALALYLPTYIDLAHGLWNTEEHAHGPIVLIVALFLSWLKLKELGGQSQKTVPLLGWPLLVVGLMMYSVGRSQDILLLEVGSQIPVMLGVLLITLGVQAAKTFWFPLFFLLFMVPLPGFIIDTVTNPLKNQISVLTEHILYFFDYPIARSGVVLSVGPYQLLVADACSGLHSMFSLSAMGLLYLYLMQHTSRLRNALLIAAILPIAFVANVVRVIVLVLITYHMGDEAGQGFLHGTAGIMLFIVGLLFLFLLDSVLGYFLPNRRAKEGKV
jgi:exosortase B